MKSNTIEGASGEHSHLNRRTFLSVTSAAIGLGVLAEGLFGNLVYADALTQRTARQDDAGGDHHGDEARQRALPQREKARATSLKSSKPVPRDNIPRPSS